VTTLTRPGAPRHRGVRPAAARMGQTVATWAPGLALAAARCSWVRFKVKSSGEKSSQLAVHAQVQHFCVSLTPESLGPDLHDVGWFFLRTCVFYFFTSNCLRFHDLKGPVLNTCFTTPQFCFWARNCLIILLEILQRISKALWYHRS